MNVRLAKILRKEAGYHPKEKILYGFMNQSNKTLVVDPNSSKAKYNQLKKEYQNVYGY